MAPKKKRSDHQSTEDSDDIFSLSFLNALSDEQIVKKLQSIFVVANKDLQDALRSTQQSVESLKVQLQAKDDIISSLRQDVSGLESRVEDLEQYSRRSSMRIYGIEEATPGTTDEKVLALCNEKLHLEPPLSLDEIAVSHRAGRKPTQGQAAAANGEAADVQAGVSQPRPILIKFVSRRSKARVMAARRGLRDVRNVYFADDLTRNRARLAYHARGLKRNQTILDTWVYDCKVLIKDKFNRIHEIKAEDDLKKFN